MPYSDENTADPADVSSKADGIKLPYCAKDPVYWFRRLEKQMQIRGIGSQFWKSVVLEMNLPPALCDSVKDLLIKEQAESANVYKDCKARLLKMYGPKPELN